MFQGWAELRFQEIRGDKPGIQLFSVIYAILIDIRLDEFPPKCASEYYNNARGCSLQSGLVIVKLRMAWQFFVLTRMIWSVFPTAAKHPCKLYRNEVTPVLGRRPTSDNYVSTRKWEIQCHALSMYSCRSSS